MLLTNILVKFNQHICEIKNELLFLEENKIIPVIKVEKAEDILDILAALEKVG